MVVGAMAVKPQLNPWHPTPYPSKFDPALASLLRVTGVPGATIIAQVPGQSIPEGEETTRPDPAPTRTTETLTEAAKFAPTCVSCESSTLQPSMPEHAPLQPMNCMPAAGDASRCTPVPAAICCAQMEAQAIDCAAAVTVPWPTTLMVKIKPLFPEPDECPPQAANSSAVAITPEFRMNFPPCVLKIGRSQSGGKSGNVSDCRMIMFRPAPRS